MYFTACHIFLSVLIIKFCYSKDAQNQKVSNQVLISFSSDLSSSSHRELLSSPTNQPILFQASNYTYRGCFKDSTPRAMENQFPGVRYNPQSCYTVASAGHYSAFALQYGGECWVSHSLIGTQKYGATTNCDMKCFDQTLLFPGNCGGSLSNAVYTINGVPDEPPVNPVIPGAPVTFTPKGCYVDKSPRAMMQLGSLGVTSTIEACARSANFQGYSFFALQWGGECWVSNSLQQSTVYGPSNQCTMPCRSVEYENCGGVLANSLYVINNPLSSIMNPSSPNDHVFCPNSPIPLSSPQFCSDGFTICNGCQYCPDGAQCCNCGAV